MRTKIYLHDRVLARTLLMIVPRTVTPNQITVMRLILTPFAALLLAFQRYDVGVPFFLFLALTDLIDGSLARTRKQVTQWGTIWDPIADKMLIGSVVVVLLSQDFPPGIVISLLTLESAFLLGGWLRKRKGIVTGANWWGKSKMVCQVAGVMGYLIYLQTNLQAMQTGSFVLFGASIFLAICSLLDHGL